MKFNEHIEATIKKANRILGGLKYALYSASKRSRLIAYQAICRPIVEYADVAWDPTNKRLTHQIEMVQNNAIRFISQIKGRDSVSDARNQLNMKSFADRRKEHRLSLLLKILADDHRQGTLASAYDSAVNTRTNSAIQTRAASQGEPTSVLTTKTKYHNSFLPRTIRDLKLSGVKN